MSKAENPPTDELPIEPQTDEGTKPVQKRQGAGALQDAIASQWANELPPGFGVRQASSTLHRGALCGANQKKEHIQPAYDQKL